MAGVLLMVGLGVWLAVCGSLQEQNQPTAARTVPGHLRTLKRAALLGWALCTALSTLLLWAIFPPGDIVPILLLSCGFIAVFLLWSSRMVWLWLLLTLLSPLLGAFAGSLAPAGRALAALWNEHTAAMLMAGLLAQAALVTLAFGAGDAGHRSRHARQTVMRNAMRMQLDGRQANAAVWGRPIEWLTRPLGMAVDAWQRRLVARADNRNPGNVMARAAIVLHGIQHWMYQLMGLAVLSTLVLIAFLAVSHLTQVSLKTFLPGAFGMGVAIASMGFNPGFALPMALWQSRREQALLCLPLGALPVMAVNLTRRAATMRVPKTMTTVWPVLAFLAATGLLYGLSQLGVPLALLAARVAALSAALLAWRWRALDAAPSALPVGRLA